MRPSATVAPSPAASSFASMLADFAAPEKKFPPARDLDGLAEDVATLSYEHALRNQARYRPPEAVRFKPLPQEPAAPVAVAQPAPDVRKCASVTVRLTAEENERLRQRAAEAGMTVSAYLRSCAFEVESLRAEVKQTLNTMRATTPIAEAAAPRPFWAHLPLWRRAKPQA